MNGGAIIATAILALSLLAGCGSTESAKNAETAAGNTPREPQDSISGIAFAADGDTVVIDENAVDLWGIEAPNLTARDGWYSRAALDGFIGENGELVCVIKVKRKKGRDLAICSNSKVGDVGRAMLQNGWAVVNRRDKRDRDVDTALAGVYQRTEQRARQTLAGLWAQLPVR